MSPEPFVAPDVLIDPFVGDIEFAADFQGAADLLGTPLLAQTGPDQLKVVLGEMTISPGSAASCACAPFRLAGTIGAVGDMTAIALKLPVDGASVSPQALSDTGRTESLQTEFPHAYSVLQGELSVNSHRCSLFGRKEKRLFWQLALLNSESVALSI